MALSFGGQYLRANQYQWLVYITVYGSGRCSGALISPRHVLTAAHCVMAITGGRPRSEQQCRGYKNTVRFYAPVHSFQIAIGSRCKKISGCPKSRIRTASWIYVPKSFNECTTAHDIAIIEFEKSVSESIATPICIPQENMAIAKNLKFAGTGLTYPGTKSKADGSTYGYQVVDVKLVKVEKDRRISTTAPFGVGICQGDSGGPLFQTDRYRRNTVVGVASRAESCRFRM